MDEAALIAQRQQQLAQVYDPQEQFIMQQKAALPGQFDSRRSALEQAKINAFRDIGTQAQRQGMFFSGFKPAEQARYLGERFLPGMQDISSQQEQARLGLLGQLIGLRGQRAGEMTGFQEQLRKERLAQQEAETERQFRMQMQQQQLRASAAQQQLTQQQKVGQKELRNTLQSFARSRGELTNILEGKKGSDGFVSPATFAAARAAAAQAGWSADLFQRNFGRYINPSHAQDYFR